MGNNTTKTKENTDIDDNQDMRFQKYAFAACRHAKTTQIQWTQKKIDEFMSGFLQHNDGLLTLQHMIINYCNFKISQYFQILMNTLPNKDLGTPNQTKKLKIFDQFDRYSNYFVSDIFCPKCYKKGLQFYCSYTSCCISTGFNNNANEFYCKYCQLFIAYNLKERILQNYVYIDYTVKLSPFINRKIYSNIDSIFIGKNERITIIPQKPISQCKVRNCNECNKPMQPLEERKIIISKDWDVDDHAFAVKHIHFGRLFMSFKMRYFCDNCELVLLIKSFVPKQKSPQIKYIAGH